MPNLAEREPSVVHFLDILEEQAHASAKVPQYTGKGTSYTVEGTKSTNDSIIYVTDNTRGRVRAGISSSTSTGLRIHHELDLRTGALGTGIFGNIDQFGDHPASIVRGASRLTLQTPRLPLMLQEFMLGLAPISIMRNLGLLKIESVFGEGALIVGLNEETVTVLIGNRVIKYNFPTLKMISSSSIDTQENRDLLTAVNDRMLKVRTNLTRAKAYFPLPRKKHGNNRPKEFDNDVLS